jgi:hypothetical protein
MFISALPLITFLKILIFPILLQLQFLFHLIYEEVLIILNHSTKVEFIYLFIQLETLNHLYVMIKISKFSKINIMILLILTFLLLLLPFS